jgi:hypothetical protein
MVTLNLYRVKEVSGDCVVLADDNTEVRITFAGGSGTGLNDIAFTKEENALFFKGIKCDVGLEAPVVPVNEPMTINIFLDHFVDLFGWFRSTPFPFPISRIAVNTLRS